MALMSDNGEIREDLRVPESEVGKEIEAKFEANEDFMVSLNVGLNQTGPGSSSGAEPPSPVPTGVGFQMIDLNTLRLLSAGHRDFCHGGGMCRRHQGLGQQMREMDFAAQATSPAHKPVSYILIGSVTKAPAFRQTWSHSVVISLIDVLISPSPPPLSLILIFLFRCCLGMFHLCLIRVFV